VQDKVPSLHAGARRSTQPLGGKNLMFGLVSTFGIVAGLSAISLFCLVVAPRLPPPFRSLGEAGILGFVLPVYLSALVSLLVGAICWPQFKEALRSRFRYLIVASTAVILGLVGYTSYVIYSISHSLV
jgi:hypothetical protein